MVHFMKKRLLTVWLCLMMVLCILPATAAGDLSGLRVDTAYSAETGKLTLTWNPADAAGFVAVGAEVGGKSYGFEPPADGRAEIPLTDPIAGSHDLQLFFKAQGDGNTATVPVTFIISETDLLGFTFAETVSARVYDPDSGNLTITWNHADAPAGTVLTGILLGGRSYDAFQGDKAVTLIPGLKAAVKPGETAFSFMITTPAGKTVTIPASEPLYVHGNVRVDMEVKVEGGAIVATVTDEFGRPVEGYEVILKINNQSYAPVETDINGRIKFNAPLPPDPEKSVLCVGNEQTDETKDGKKGGVTYSAVVKGIGGGIVIPPTGTTAPPPTGTTTGSGTTSTTTNGGGTTSTAPPNTETTKAPSPLVNGAGTTGIVGDQVAVNVSFEQALLNAFGLSKTDFESRARLLMSQTVYQALAGGDTPSTVMMAMRASSRTVTPAQIGNITHGVSKYSVYDTSKVLTLTADLTLQIIDHNGAESFMPTTAVDSITYTVQLPVPKSMKDIKLFAAAEVTDTGLVRLIDATLEDGFIRFTAPKMGEYVLLGFVEATSANPRGDVPVLLIVLIVVGVLLLAGAGVLLYFFVLRKPKDEDDDDFPPDGGLTTLADDINSPDSGSLAGTIFDTSIPQAVGQTGPEPSEPTVETDAVVPLVPLTPATPPAPPIPPASRRTAPEEDRDIYSSDSKRPGYRGGDTGKDVSLGTFQQPGENKEQKPQKKNPSDYDLDL